MPAPPEPSPEPYNEMYLHNDRTYDDPDRSPYLPVFRAVIEEARRLNLRRLIEVGCGSGTLAHMLIEELSLEYVGFDIADEGVKKARRRNPTRGTFFVGDATHPSAYRFDYDGVVCIEVLEHILEDRLAISQWRSGVICICTVPNFDYDTHVRKFQDEDEILHRYADLIDIDHIARVRKPIWSGGLTVSQYLRRIRWNLYNPRYVAGMLGINSFQNYAGWFVFSGRRR